jgi:RNA polymerase sigma-70 factor (ECF subfamily)
MLSFHELYEQHFRDVHRFALFLCGDPAMADDLTADTFVRAWTARGSIRETTLRAYLLTITRNLWRDRQRREWRHVPLDESIGERGAFQAQAEHAIDLRWTEKRLASVANGDREALLLYARDGLSYQEIGRRLGIAVGAVKSRIFRARHALMALRAGGHEGGTS